MKVLLSIKPEFVSKILDGTKIFEFRKAIFKNKEIKKVVIYASSPVQRVVGEFTIDNILKGDIDTIWKKTKKRSGISENFYRLYFANKDIAYAIKIGRVTPFKKMKTLQDYNLKFPPQSYAYII